MAKRIKQPRQPNRRHISRMEKEHRQRQWLYVGTGVVFALVIGLLAWALVDNYVLKPARPVAVVAGQEIRTDAYQKMLQYRRYDAQMYLQMLQEQRQQYASAEGQEWLVDYIDQQIQQVQQSYASLPQTVLEDMIQDVIIRQEAAARGITVTEEEVQALLEQQFGYDRTAAAAAEVVATLEAQGTASPTTEPTAAPSLNPSITATASAAITDTAALTTTAQTATPELTATVGITQTATPYPTEVPMTEAEFTERSTLFFETVEKEVGFTEADFRRLLESSLYRDKVEAALKAEMPTVAEQVHARHILVATEEEARQVLDRLAAGEAFDALAQELSIDTASAANGGDLGWFSRGQMVAEFEEAAFSLAPGTVSDPVATTYGYHIIEVLEHEQDRPLEGSALTAFQDALLQAWYSERTQGEDVVRYWTPDLVPEDPFVSG